MGREIRMVPEGWKHPRDRDGDYRPLYDGSYSLESARWIEEFDLWRKDEHPTQIRARRGYDFYDTYHFWEYESPPDKFMMRPDWEAQGIAVDHYQVYQTVSEGTPVTPVFRTKEELVDYLVEHGDFWDQRRGEGGWSREAAESFVEMGSAPSIIVSRTPMSVEIYEPRDGPF